MPAPTHAGMSNHSLQDVVVVSRNTTAIVHGLLMQHDPDGLMILLKPLYEMSLSVITLMMIPSASVDIAGHGVLGAPPF